MLTRWSRDERKEQLVASMAAKQKKRTDNIAMRNERRNDKRKGVKTKNKARPGFEGKAFGKGKAKAGPRGSEAVAHVVRCAYHFCMLILYAFISFWCTCNIPSMTILLRSAITDPRTECPYSLRTSPAFQCHIGVLVSLVYVQSHPMWYFAYTSWS